MHSCLAPECGKSFKKQTTPMKHLRVHSLERPCPCSVCGKTFAIPSGRIAHGYTHRPCSDRPSACKWPGCNKKCINPSKLKKHVRIHTGGKRFVCDFPRCGK